MRIRITIEYDLDLEREPSTQAEIAAAIANERHDWEHGGVEVADLLGNEDATVTYTAVGVLGEVA